jgi:hypothetical protein
MLRKTFLVLLSFLTLGCSDDDHLRRGLLRMRFAHKIANEPVRFRSLEYQNGAGNKYEVTNVQWFISRFRLYTADGSFVEITEPLSHYVDSDIEETLTCTNDHRLPEGEYTAMSFVFGLEGSHNTPGQFPNAPESNMEWPLHLGGPEGGYHYMKLNGFWLDDSQARRPFNLHLGVGQIYDENGNILRYVQNWFEVRTPVDFTIQEKDTTDVTITMNIDSWFDSPNRYDLDVLGGMIMTRQDAMHILCENGVDVFTIEQEQLP